MQSNAATWNIVYPRPLTETDQRNEYPVKLLALAMDHTGVKYRLTPTQEIMLQDKALKQLGENRGVNVVWSMTDEEREKRLIPIRIPIYKGLIGWRLLLVREESLAKFTAVDTLQSLLKLKPIQGRDWPDTKILQSNGFDVITAKNYPEIFTMLADRKGELLPRSMAEVWAELENEKLDPAIVLEPTLGIKYPAAMYFFVNKSNKLLARLLTDGLEKAIANGKFDELFLQQFAPIIERANLDQRFFFELENPLLPAATPLDRKELWY